LFQHSQPQRLKLLRLRLSLRQLRLQLAQFLEGNANLVLRLGAKLPPRLLRRQLLVPSWYYQVWKRCSQLGLNLNQLKL
jgi:hypothetical protein